jgi:lipopolysaccharide transport system permease protein
MFLGNANVTEQRMLTVSTTDSKQTDTAPVPNSRRLLVIKPVSGWQLVDLRELWSYRDLFYFLVWREIKVRYAQSILGIGWAVVQPLFFMVVFTIVFGRLANIGSDGIPYAVFSYTALVPWAYFSNALTDATGSLLANTNLLTKVYFPRLILPLSAVVGKLVDFAIAGILVIGFLLWYKIVPTIWILTLPFLVVLMMVTAAGIGMLLTALAVQYRDVKYAITFLLQGAMYASPVVYPVSKIPEEYRLAYAINPMVGVIEGFRAAIIGVNPMPWDMIAIGTGVSVVLLIAGTFYFRRSERNFSDVA